MYHVCDFRFNWVKWVQIWMLWVSNCFVSMSCVSQPLLQHQLVTMLMSESNPNCNNLLSVVTFQHALVPSKVSLPHVSPSAWQFENLLYCNQIWRALVYLHFEVWEHLAVICFLAKMPFNCSVSLLAAPQLDCQKLRGCNFFYHALTSITKTRRHISVLLPLPP